MMATGVVSLDSDLRRKQWVREGLIQSASKSLWNGLIGRSSMDSVVYQKNDLNASEGMTVVFDFDGNLTQRAIKGKNTASGKGEQKKKFSSKITVDRYRLVVDNGDSFDGAQIGDLNITQHQDARKKLADLFQRFKDQALIDSAQGHLGLTPSHKIDLSSFSIGDLIDIETVLKTGNKFSSGSTRRPPEPWRTQDGEPVWLFVIDSFAAGKLKKDSDYRSILSSADVRGNQNRIIKGVIGKLGHLYILEWPNFFGVTYESSSTWGLEDTDIEIAGLRQYDSTNDKWTGQEGFSYSSNLVSRGLILGAGAIQLAFGKMPDYKWQSSPDFGIKSESCLEVWMNTQKTRLLAENKDYEQAKVAGMDWGVVAVDITI